MKTLLYSIKGEMCILKALFEIYNISTHYWLKCPYDKKYVSQIEEHKSIKVQLKEL